MYGRLPFGKALRNVMKPQDMAAVMYSACGAGLMPAGPDGIGWPTPHYSLGLGVLYRIQAWWVTVRPVGHHVVTSLAQPL